MRIRLRSHDEIHPSSTSRRKNRRRGVTAVETAVILSLFITLILYFIQFAWYFMCLHTVQGAARYGARSWAVQDFNPADAEQRAAQFLTDNGFTASEFQISSIVPDGKQITFTVSIPATSSQVAIIGDPFGILSNQDGSLTGTMTMRSERSY